MTIMKMMARQTVAAAGLAALLGMPTATEARQQGQAGAQQQPDGQRVEGKVREVQRVRLKDSKRLNTVVLLETTQGKRIVVDLADSAQHKGMKVQKGASLQVEGTVVNMRGTPVLIASRVTADGKSAELKRDKPSQQRRPKVKQVSGKIEKIREVGVKGADAKHQVAVVQVGQRKLYADLGPKDQLEQLDLKAGTQVRLKGVAVRMKGRTILLAQNIRANDRSVDVQRSAIPAASKMPQK